MDTCGYNSCLLTAFCSVSAGVLQKWTETDAELFSHVGVSCMNKGSGPALIRDSLQGKVQGTVTWMVTCDVLSVWELTFIQVSGSGSYSTCSYNILHGVFAGFQMFP